MKNKILDQYKAKFKNPKIYVQSPGRANIIGEHTDYNQGLVLPFAIEQSIHMFIGRNKLNKLRLFAADPDEYVVIDLEGLQFSSKGWTRYFVNSLVVLQMSSGEGIDVAFGGNLPSGAGLSSSSAITCGFLAGINVLFNLKIEQSKLINFASQAENGIGLKGGTMDQTIIIKGRKNNVMCIDFLDNTMQSIFLQDEGYNFYIFDSGQKHNLVETGYNDRRTTCEKAIGLLKNEMHTINSFRDVTKEDLDTWIEDEITKKRCQHVISENQRVLDAIQAIENSNYPRLGQLMNESHHSLSLDYEVSTSEIDYLIQQSRKIPNVLGSRIMGGGFGGSTIILVTGVLNPLHLMTLKKNYKSRTGYKMEAFMVKPASGVRVETVV